MAVIDPFDLVLRLKDAPLAQLVAGLKRLHEGGPAQAPIEDLFAAAGIQPAADAAASGADLPPRPADYEAARRHFVRHAERLREQALLTERLLDGFAATASGTPATLQQELRIQCASGGRSGARFAVVNGLDRAVTLRCRSGKPHGLDAGAAAAFEAAFAPAECRLEPGAEQEIQMAVAIPAIEAGRDLDLGVDVLGDDRVLLKLWVRIEVRSEERHG